MAVTKKQLSKIQRQKAAVRDSLWPGVDDSILWSYQSTDGWLIIPRALPLILQIMDRLSKGKPVSSTYLDLWCRTFNDSFVVASKPREMAFFSGFSGERAERTWASRIRILADLGFIVVEDGPSGPISYVLILNPYLVVRKHHKAGRVDAKSYNALIDRMIEIGAKELDEQGQPAAAGGLTSSYVDWTGKSGTAYRYWFLDNPTAAGIQAVAGNYAFVKRLPDGKFVPVYFGQADDLQARIPNHDRWSDAVRTGATHVMAHTTPGGKQARFHEERDLIQQWNVAGLASVSMIVGGA
jgi:hypothetical protein